METFGDKNSAKFCSKFYCKNCDYATSKKSSYKDHILSAKHQNNHLGDAISTNSALILLKAYKFECNGCSRPYQSRNGLWKHQKKCLYKEKIMTEKVITEKEDENIKESLITDKALIMMLVKQNSELMEVLKNGTTHTNYSNNNHSNNKTFNLQFFLNETCKDAMNIGEFVNSIKPQLNDLEATGRLGYVEGISNIILTNLKNLATQSRPIHCSDQKREIIYIKNNNEWTKEEDNKPILTNAIKIIANENIKNINKWTKEYPDCTKADSKKNDMYLKIVSNSMNGLTKEESTKNIHKIISNIAKQVVINKSLN